MICRSLQPERFPSLGQGEGVLDFLRAYDLETGKLVWQAEAGTSVHSTSILGKLPDGRHAILTGAAGGRHKPPEENPRTFLWIDASNGKTLGPGDPWLCGGPKCKLGRPSGPFFHWERTSLGQDQVG